MKPSDLSEVTEEVNCLPYISDAERYDLPEFWDDIQAGGDCEDYAIGKLNRLVKRGWPIENLRLACCYAETGDYHAVLIVSADDGDYMLDNRQPHPTPVGDIDVLGYRRDKIQRVGGSRDWVKWLGS